ncbi:sorting nexin-24 isoform X3 [Nannospalax galili]|uniref:sorting nexin-24 isoform X3 n=1 Tax=Nannospalax galili TaxID=1026970 RepID=UPI0004ED4B13|nr:sorting nexin-24 isoform X3 [Nannospalax galili]
MEVYIPSFRHEESDLERGYTVFKIEVLMNGRKHFVEKRYSEFHALHKKAVILENEELPKLFLDFLNVRHLPSLPKAESCGSFDETESEESSKLSHQPVLLFLGDPYVLPAASAYFELEEEEFSGGMISSLMVLNFSMYAAEKQYHVSNIDSCCGLPWIISLHISTLFQPPCSSFRASDGPPLPHSTGGFLCMYLLVRLPGASLFSQASC